jgi:hypothetical protein
LDFLFAIRSCTFNLRRNAVAWELDVKICSRSDGEELAECRRKVAMAKSLNAIKEDRRELI